jgi:hypothetical protein
MGYNYGMTRALRRRYGHSMKTVTMPGGRAHEYRPAHPERTAYRNANGAMNFDVIFREWPNRAAMLKTIEMQGRREPRQDDWRDWSTSRYAKIMSP